MPTPVPPPPPVASAATDRPTRGDGLLAWALWLAPVGLIILGLIIAVLLFALDRWRRGSFVLGAVAVWTAGMRLLLPEWRLGLLAVRGRYSDAGFLAAVGALTMFLALSVDDLAG